MQCLVCEKTFAVELSVCPSCGAMQTQHNQAESSLRFLSIEKITTSDLELEIGEPVPARITAPLEDEKIESLEARVAEFHARRSEIRTLLEFPSKQKPKSPEWRDDIKNLVKRRKEGVKGEPVAEAKPKKSALPKEPALVINLKPNLLEKKAKNVLADALERIERSRQQFGGNESMGLAAETEIEDAPAVETVNKIETSNAPLSLVPSVEPPVPRKVLPPIDDVSAEWFEADIADAPKVNTSVINVPLNLPATPQSVFAREREKIETIDEFDDEETINAALNSVRKVSAQQSPLDNQQPVERVSPVRNLQRERQEDYAPLAPRFMAGVIDLFLSAAGAIGLLAAFGFAQTTGLELQSLLLILGAIGGVLFAYSTASVMLTGTTLGLRFFRMYVVTAEEGDAPSVLQTILNSTVYVLSLALAGIGLLTILLSTEKRALHDIVAGTVVIQED